MRLKITRTAITSTPAPASGTIYLWDTELRGFGVRIGVRDRTFIVKSRLNGNQIWVTLGGFPVMTPEAARKKALDTLGTLQSGINPNKPEVESLAESVTLRQALDRYLEARGEKMKASSAKSIRWYITHYLDTWLDLRLSTITSDMVEKRHRELGTRGPRSANLTMKYLRSLFNAARILYTTPAGTQPFTLNPTRRLTDMRTWYDERPKTRVIPAEKIGTAILALAEKRRMAYDLIEATSADYLLFLLFTGSRMNEAARLAWADVDFARQTFTFKDTKNKRPHTLPMSDVVEALLLLRKPLADKSPWVFPGDGKSGHIFDAKRLCGVLSKSLGAPFSHHDLRRVFTTVGKSVVEGDWVSILLNHTLQTVTGKHYFVPGVEELRDPLQRITDKLKTLAGWMGPLDLAKLPSLEDPK